MHVKELQLSNFRGFESLTLQFHEKLTVLVGVNGSGKTSVLDAVARAMPRALGGAEKIQPSEVRNGAEEASVEVKVVAATILESTISTMQRSRPPVVAPSAIDGSAPIAVFFSVGRHARDATPAASEPENWGRADSWSVRGTTEFGSFFRWFREREDLENEEIRVSHDHRDQQLEAVRTAIGRSLPGYSRPRVYRARASQHAAFRGPVLVVSKGSDDFTFDQLSEGERILVAMVADIARRLCIANESNPLEGEGVVLIDEIELHLHPKWQAEIIPALQRTFPNLQFIVTTHSPIVLSRVPAECIRLLEDFQVYDAPGKTKGRDPNALLLEVFDTPLRPEDVTAQLRAIGDLIDADDLDGAREALDALAESLGERDSEVARLRTMLSVLAS